MKNENSVILITKDAMCRDYLPVYGNKYWKGKTPNIDELASKGVVYEKFYTAAPSSAMSYLSMFTSKYPYEQEIGTFKPVDTYQGETLFDKANKLGFETHIIWDEGWMFGAYRYSSCYGQNTTIHPIKNLGQRVGAQFKHEDSLKSDEKTVESSIESIKNELTVIFRDDKKKFIWIHIPHVIKGRTCYGSDIDVFDRIVGILRTFVNDDNIYISADHGNMNGALGKLGYGFDVSESASRIPLITPKKQSSLKQTALLVNIDLYNIIFADTVKERSFIFIDTAYYAQKNRTLGIVTDEYKYVYHKKTGKEELFDLSYDPNENFNLIEDTIYDADRKFLVPSKEEYFYPKWDKLNSYRTFFRDKKKSIWRKATFKQKVLNGIKDFVRPLYVKLRKLFSK